MMKKTSYLICGEVLQYDVEENHDEVKMEEKMKKLEELEKEREEILGNLNEAEERVHDAYVVYGMEYRSMISDAEGVERYWKDKLREIDEKIAEITEQSFQE